jgi:hypothetical protein
MCDSQVPRDLLQNARNVGGGVLAGGLGAPVDILTMLMRPAGYKVPDEKVVGSSEHIAGLMGLDTKSAPYMVGSLLPTDAGDLMKYGGLLGGHIAYHGSPHKFDKFDSKKIGTGEGAQVYGHGLYFAENPKVAEDYQKGVLDNAKIDAANKRMAELVKVMDADAAYPGAYRQFKSDAGKKAAAEYDAAMASKMEPGSLYKADIADSAIPKMLDWDKKLSQQSESVQASVRAAFADAGIPDAWKMDPDGQSVNAWLSAAMAGGKKSSDRQLQQRAAGLLQQHGVPGIRYKDAGSRGKDGGTSNFVVFDDSLVKILERK